MSVFTGAAVAIVTPFAADGSVNYDKFGALIDYQIAHKTDAIVVVGTTGEASTLSHEEHIECIRFCVERVAGRVPVIAGTGSNCTETAVYLTEEADKAGADAMLVVSPYYNKSTQKGLYLHFRTIAEATSKPIILYNIQGRTGVNIAPATVNRLYRDVPNIVGIKEASGNISQVAEIAALTEGGIDIYSGNDDQVVPILSLGGKGVISVASHVIPEEMHNMVEAFRNGDTKTAAELQLKYIPLCKALFCEVNPIPVKKALNLMGFEVGGYRAPLCEMEPENAARVEAELKRLGIIG